MKRLVFGLVLTAFALPVMAVPFSYLDSNNLVASYDGSENVYQYVLSPLNFFTRLLRPRLTLGTAFPVTL